MSTADPWRRPALERRFQPVRVAEPTIAHTIEILRGLRDRYEAHHRVSITDGALVAAAQLADRYVSDRFLPDKAIDLIDEAGARMRIRRMTAPPALREYEREDRSGAPREGIGHRLAGLREGRRAARQREAAAGQEGNAGEGVEGRRHGRRRRGDRGTDRGGPGDRHGHILVSKLTQEESQPRRTEDELDKRADRGHGVAVRSLSQAIRRNLGAGREPYPSRPGCRSSSPACSGVGKTELSRCSAESPVRGDEDSLIQPEISEYMDKHMVSRPFVFPPVDVGSEEGGRVDREAAPKAVLRGAVR